MGYLKNGRIADTSYLTAPSNTINGETVFTSDSVTAYSKWVLEPYTGEDLYGVGWLSYSSNLIVGERFYYEGYMYAVVFFKIEIHFNIQK